MDYTRLLKSTKKRNRLVYIWIALSGILTVTAFIFIFVHKNTDTFLPLALFFLCLAGVFAESIILLSLAFTEKRRNYDLFQNNTIIINKYTATKPRKTDKYAIEKHEGDLKKALNDIVTTPDLTRVERMCYFMEWHDYERDFVAQQYGSNLHRVAETSRKFPLRADGKEYICAVCIKKYKTDPTDYSSEEFLDFGPHGKWKVHERHLYFLTEPGDEFYLLKSPSQKKIVEAYSLLDWELIKQETEE